MKLKLRVCLWAILATLAGRADSNIDPNHSTSWAANIGWLNWNGASGAEIGEYVCSGFVYSPNVGWISLGSGQPANGIRYQNNSATDYGVNCDTAGNLRGYAYGANIGWIAFEDKGAPHIDSSSGR